MSPPASRPDPEKLRQFLLGKLGEPERSRVEEFVLQTPDEVLDLGSLESHDPLVRSLRTLGRAAGTTNVPQVDALVCRMEQLVLPARETLDQRPTSSEAEGPRVAGVEADLGVLSPPLFPDELGRLGEYRVLKKLDSGGMGIVFLAEDPALRRRVALKVMRPEIAALPVARHRFLREAQAAAALEHENVVPIYQVGETPQGMPFIAMQFLTGESLADRLDRDGPLPLAEILRVGREIAQGLAAAHAVGLIHRDIKPANIWLYERPGAEDGGPRGQVKVLDFGLARSLTGDTGLTQSGALVGTPAYMAPEQANGETVDARVDLFSLGCVLYHMTTGGLPFPGKTQTAVLRAVAEHQPPAPHEVQPGTPPALSALILQLLAKDPNHRPALAREVREVLRKLEAGEPVHGIAVPPALPPARCLPAPPTKPRFRWAVAATGLVLVMCGGWFGFRALFGRSRPPDRPGPPTVTAADHGSVDVLVWSRTGGDVRKLRLTDPGALPLYNGDQIRITARAEPTGYLYLFWIDSEGETAPIYPWQPGKWGTRPARETPTDRLDLPPRLSTGYTLRGEQEGMETLVLLLRDTPLSTADAELQRLLAGLPAQRPVQDSRAAVWFENSRVVEHDVGRKRAHFVVEHIDDPVLRLQDLLRAKLQPLGRYTAAVSFARMAK